VGMATIGAPFSVLARAALMMIDRMRRLAAIRKPHPAGRQPYLRPTSVSPRTAFRAA
jgi:hypothetical protein